MKLSLIYKGPSVDDGTMSANELGLVIEGLLSAYVKVVRIEGGRIPRIDKIALGRGSADISMEFLENPDSVADALKYLRILVRWIEFVRWSEGKPVTPKDFGMDDVILENFDGDIRKVPIVDWKRLQENETSFYAEMKRMNAPLQEGNCDSWTMKGTSEVSGNSIETTVTRQERPYFEQESLIRKREDSIIGRINRITKSNRTGTLHREAGNPVPFKFVGADPSHLFQCFPHDGPVKLNGVVHFDEGLNPVKVDVHSIELIQGSLYPTLESEGVKVLPPAESTDE